MWIIPPPMGPGTIPIRGPTREAEEPLGGVAVGGRERPPRQVVDAVGQLWAPARPARTGPPGRSRRRDPGRRCRPPPSRSSDVNWASSGSLNTSRISVGESGRMVPAPGRARDELRVRGHERRPPTTAAPGRRAGTRRRRRQRGAVAVRRRSRSASSQREAQGHETSEQAGCAEDQGDRGRRRGAGARLRVPGEVTHRPGRRPGTGRQPRPAPR